MSSEQAYAILTRRDAAQRAAEHGCRWRRSGTPQAAGHWGWRLGCLPVTGPGLDLDGQHAAVVDTVHELLVC